jgi:hypothetical protein
LRRLALGDPLQIVEKERRERVRLSVAGAANYPLVLEASLLGKQHRDRQDGSDVIGDGWQFVDDSAEYVAKRGDPKLEHRIKEHVQIVEEVLPSPAERELVFWRTSNKIFRLGLVDTDLITPGVLRASA